MEDAATVKAAAATTPTWDKPSGFQHFSPLCKEKGDKSRLFLQPNLFSFPSFNKCVTDNIEQVQVILWTSGLALSIPRAENGGLFNQAPQSELPDAMIV